MKMNIEFDGEIWFWQGDVLFSQEEIWSWQEEISSSPGEISFCSLPGRPHPTLLVHRFIALALECAIGARFW